MVSKSAVIGIDLGACESYVAYVGKGMVDTVQNEVSKRATSTLVGFTSRERLLGDAAMAQVKSNAKNSCRNFKHLLGQSLDAPYVEKEKFWSTCPLETAEDGHVGYSVTYKGEPRVFSAPQVAAAFLTKLRDVTETWCQAKVADVVIGVPSYYSDVHRQALLDGAKIANVSVLRLMNEHTATALAYGIYRSNDFDAEKPCTVAFCSMGHSIFSVSIVKFVKGKLTVVCEASDKVGGRDMDECLMRVFSDQFKKKVGCSPIDNKKASIKLEDSVTKTKKILSANAEAGINCECLMEDEDFSSNITRADFESMCQPMMDKVHAVLEKAKTMSGVPVAEIDFVEVVGGSSRVPWVKRMCSEAFGGKELSTTMNADESVCRGCALQAAMLSPLYKVRDFKVEDCSPYAISIGWIGSSADAEATDDKDEDGDAKMMGGEGEYKTALVFPANSQMNVLKMLTFYRKGPFEITAEYADPSQLIPGTSTSLGSYKIELTPQEVAKKVKVKAKLTLNGTFVVEGAQVVEEEDYEEVTKEKREIPAAEGENPEAPMDVSEASTSPGPSPPADGATPKQDDAGAAGATEVPMGDAKDAEKKEGEEKASPKEPAKKAPEKKYEWVEVKKMKKRTKRTDLPISPSGAPGLSSPVVQKRMDEETAIQSEMRDIIETDEKRNDLESYIFTMRDKISSSGMYGAFVTDADRDKMNGDLMTCEDWLYDNPEATKTQFVEKLDELKKAGDPIVWRYNEDSVRPEWINAVSGTITNYRDAAANSGEKYGHIAADKLEKIVKSCNDLQTWLDDLRAKQDTLPKTEKPVLLCADMEKKNQEMAKMADEILKEPKPAPPKPEPKPEEKKEGEAAAEGAPPAEEKKEGAADGPQNMDVD
jgi:molecular chaperone DnaK (HSP70)